MFVVKIREFPVNQYSGLHTHAHTSTSFQCSCLSDHKHKNKMAKMDKKILQFRKSFLWLIHRIAAQCSAKYLTTCADYAKSPQARHTHNILSYVFVQLKSLSVDRTMSLFNVQMHIMFLVFTALRGIVSANHRIKTVNSPLIHLLKATLTLNCGH